MAGTNVEVPHMRYLRHRRLDGLVRGAEGATNDIPRLKKLGTWLDQRVTDIGATGAGQVFTAAVTNIVTITTHGRVSGDGPFTVSSDTTLPAGLLADTQYWLNVIDVNTFTVHLTREEAFNDLNEIDITDTGTGTHTMIPDGRSEGFQEIIRQEIVPDRIQAETDIDNLI